MAKKQRLKKFLLQLHGNRPLIKFYFIQLIEYVKRLIIHRTFRQYVFSVKIRAFIRHSADKLFIAGSHIHHIFKIPRRDLSGLPHRPAVSAFFVISVERTHIIRNPEQKYLSDFFRRSETVGIFFRKGRIFFAKIR